MTEGSHYPHNPHSHPGLGVVPRPGTVTAGAVLAWLGSAGLVAAGVATMIRATGTDRGSVLAATNGAVSLTGAVVAIGGGIGLLLTTLAFRGSRGALITLTTLAAICAAVPIAAAAYLLVSNDPTVRLPISAAAVILWAGVAIGLFWSGHSWFGARRRG